MLASQFMTDLISRGRYCFVSEEAARVLGTSVIATRMTPAIQAGAY